MDKAAVGSISDEALEQLREEIGRESALALEIAAATNFSILMLATYWDKVTRLGVLCVGVEGLLAVLVLLILGPTFSVQLLGNPDPVFPSDCSTLISAPFAFFVAFVVSMLGCEGLEEKQKYVAGEVSG